MKPKITVVDIEPLFLKHLTKRRKCKWMKCKVKRWRPTVLLKGGIETYCWKTLKFGGRRAYTVNENKFKTLQMLIVSDVTCPWATDFKFRCSETYIFVNVGKLWWRWRERDVDWVKDELFKCIMKTSLMNYWLLREHGAWEGKAFQKTWKRCSSRAVTWATYTANDT